MDKRDIETKLVELKAELANVRGTQTEVYTRIVGYYRSVRNWNAGKREEYGIRRLFNVPADSVENASTDCVEQAAFIAETAQAQKSPAAYLFFTRQTCPNCPPVRHFVDSLGMDGTHVDVDTEEGLDAARKYGVMASPTVIFLDNGEKELFRAHNIGDLKARIPARA